MSNHVVSNEDKKIPVSEIKKVKKNSHCTVVTWQ